MGDFMDKFTVRKLKIIARVSGMYGYSRLCKSELIRKLEEYLYFYCEIKCSCGYDATHLWMDWAADFYDLKIPFLCCKPCLFNCPNCGLQNFFNV